MQRELYQGKIITLFLKPKFSYFYLINNMFLKTYKFKYK